MALAKSETGVPAIFSLLFDPLPLAYRHDPRFAALRRRAGLPPPAALTP